MFDKDMICHYTNWKNAISILKEKRINFSRLIKCDDPRESKQWNFNFIGTGQRLCLEYHGDAPKIFDNSIKNNSMILCFCGWNNEEMNFENNAIPPYRQDYYRVGWARSRMWSHHGEKHTGACLVFDKNKLEEQFQASFETYKKFTGEVEYQYYLKSFATATKIECNNIIKYGINKALEMQIDTYSHEFFS